MLDPTAIPSSPVPAAVLAQEHRRTRDVRVRDRLVFVLAPLITHAGARTDAEATVALRALLSAVDAFDPERDGAVEDYAWSRVRAALASSL